MPPDPNQQQGDNLSGPIGYLDDHGVWHHLSDAYGGLGSLTPSGTNFLDLLNTNFTITGRQPFNPLPGGADKPWPPPGSRDSIPGPRGGINPFLPPPPIIPYGPGVGYRSDRPNNPIDKSGHGGPQPTPNENSGSCPPPYYPPGDKDKDPCTAGKTGVQNRRDIVNAWSNLMQNIQDNHSFLDSMGNCSSSAGDFASCLLGMAGLGDKANGTGGKTGVPPPNLVIGCDDDRLGKEGKMGHTDKNNVTGNKEITLNLSSIQNAASSSGLDYGAALQSTILHELAHACKGSELDARFIESMFYPNTRFNKINYRQNRGTLTKICQENTYSGSDTIVQGKIFQWDYSSGLVSCIDADGTTGGNIPDNKGSMQSQTDQLQNEFLKNCNKEKTTGSNSH